MPRQLTGRSGDLILRALGIVMLAIGVLMTRLLSHATQAAGAHDVSLVALGLAAAGFVGLSGGSVMGLLGRRLFDQITVSTRWQHAPRGRG